ncbi:hypothetical protein B0T11DRAFT_108144 [Plectosphaerella cucumerina]|uniref:Uncharacterized protein n=1 Tax=Plectosphaerella cucumerina TaxID=40658 RepID=A0A8K0TBZ4_9PEZI|nr:hypothetical protein B0T11DRAFT_108144 [Plectosphaerella cucumerina]
MRGGGRPCHSRSGLRSHSQVPCPVVTQSVRPVLVEYPAAPSRPPLSACPALVFCPPLSSSPHPGLPFTSHSRSSRRKIDGVLLIVWHVDINPPSFIRPTIQKDRPPDVSQSLLAAVIASRPLSRSTPRIDSTRLDDQSSLQPRPHPNDLLEGTCQLIFILTRLCFGLNSSRDDLVRYIESTPSRCHPAAHPRKTCDTYGLRIEQPERRTPPSSL